MGRGSCAGSSCEECASQRDAVLSHKSLRSGEGIGIEKHREISKIEDNTHDDLVLSVKEVRRVPVRAMLAGAKRRI